MPLKSYSNNIFDGEILLPYHNHRGYSLLSITSHEYSMHVPLHPFYHSYTYENLDLSSRSFLFSKSEIHYDWGINSKDMFFFFLGGGGSAKSKKKWTIHNLYPVHIASISHSYYQIPDFSTTITTMIIPWVYHGYTMVIPRLYQGYTKVIPRLYQGYKVVIAYLFCVVRALKVGPTTRLLWRISRSIWPKPWRSCPRSCSVSAWFLAFKNGGFPWENHGFRRCDGDFHTWGSPKIMVY